MGKGNVIGLLLFAAVLLALPRLPGLAQNAYYIGILVWCGIYSLICMGLSLFMGYCGQISLGQAGFCALGAYISGILTTKGGFAPWPALVVSLVVTLAVAFAVGVPSLRLKGHYLAMATLGFGVIIYVVADADPFSLTGGPSGFWGVPKLSIFGWVLKNELRWYYFVWGVVVLGMILLLNVVNSRVGRALKAIHGSETAAKAMGVNVAKYKTQAFLLSATMASLAGSLYAHFVRFVSPPPFSLVFSIHLVTMVVVGGVTSLWGAVAGTALLTVLTEYFRVFKEISLLLDGLILIVIMLLFPEGLFIGIARKIAGVAGAARRAGRAGGPAVSPSREGGR